MKRYSRHFLYLYLRWFGILFLLLHLFLAVAGMALFLPQHPEASPLRLLWLAPDLVLVQFPVTLVCCAAVAAVLFVGEVERQQGFFWIRLSGRDPRRFLLPILVFGAVLAVFLAWFNAQVLPRIRYQLDYQAVEPGEDRSGALLMLARNPELLPGYRIRFEPLPGGRLSRIALFSGITGSPGIIYGREGSIQTGDTMVRLRLQDGRILASGKNRLEQNVSFKNLELAFDAASVFTKSKTEILNPRYYTNSEFRLLPEQKRLREIKGLKTGRRIRRIIRGAGQLAATRRQSALLPFLALGLTLYCAGGGIFPFRKWRALVPVIFCICLLVPEQILLESQAAAGKLSHPLAAFLPLFEAVIFLAVWQGASLVARRRA